MQKIMPSLWFDNNAEEAMNFYISTFKNSKVLSVTRFTEAGPGVAGSVLSCSFEIEGQEFVAINGGPAFNFTEAVSFAVNCASQEEVDYLWDALIANGGEPSQCGWLKDKFGLSWQIIPTALSEMLGDPDPEKAKRVMEAMLKMSKLDTRVLKQAYDGQPA